MKSTRFAQPGGPWRAEPVLDQQLLRQREHESDDRHRDGAAHAVRRDDGRDAVLVAGGEIDIVVADAEAGDGGEPVRRWERTSRANAMREQDQRVATFEAARRHDAVDGIDPADFDVRLSA